MNKPINKADIDFLYQKSLERTRLRIQKERELYYQNWKHEIINKPLVEGQTEEERKANKKRLLNYVHKYVFLQRLEPIDNTSMQTIKVLENELTKKSYLKQFLILRNVLSNFFRIKTVLILCSAFFFFFIEYFIHYYSSFSLSDVNVTFENLITKIPPFC